MIKYSIVAFLLVVVLAAGGAYYVYMLNGASAPAIQTGSTPGVTDTEILLGSSSALSGPAASLGTNLISGANVAIREINEAGGVNGRILKLVSYDDQYDPPKAVENTQKLINEDKVFVLFNYVGTPTGVKVMPVVADAKVPLVGMFTGAEAFRNPLQRYIFNIRGSYYQETELATRYFVDNLGLKKIAVLYQADAFGIAGFEGTKIALDKRGLKPVATGTYERNTVDVEEGTRAITASDAQAVIMIGTYSPLAKSVELIKGDRPEMLFHTVSFVGPEAFIHELNGKTDNVFVTQVVPPTYYGELFDAVKRYNDGLAKYYPDTEATFGGLEGYVNTKILAEGIRLAGTELTREGLVGALESLKNFDVGIGVNVSFSPTNHQGLDKVYLTDFDKGTFEIVPVK
ncbi:MAG: ABC transporter substrate-binding protein [Patescibacteria group bacterium]